MESFKEIVSTLSGLRFKHTPRSERELGEVVHSALSRAGFDHKREVSIQKGRIDLMTSSGPFVIELKRVARSEICEQLDRYSTVANGLVVVCWKATRPFKEAFRVAAKTAKIPVTLIELKSKAPMI